MRLASRVCACSEICWKSFRRARAKENETSRDAIGRNSNNNNNGNSDYDRRNESHTSFVLRIINSRSVLHTCEFPHWERDRDSEREGDQLRLQKQKQQEDQDIIIELLLSLPTGFCIHKKREGKRRRKRETDSFQRFFFFRDLRLGIHGTGRMRNTQNYKRKNNDVSCMKGKFSILPAARLPLAHLLPPKNLLFHFV